MALLNVTKLTKNFGGVKAVTDVDLEVEENTITGIIGPNGAGKTTFFNLLTGIYKPSSGDIIYHINGDVTSRMLRPQKMTKYGIARTFQNIRLFKEMTVTDNVLLGYHCNLSYGVFPSVLRLPSYFREEKESHGKSP